MTPKELSTKIIAGILKKHPVSYATLENHANSLGIAPGIFQGAMALVQKDKTVYGRMKGGEIVYAPKVKTVKEPGTNLKWIRENYPPMTAENDGSGIEADYSYLFLSPAEVQEFKAGLVGKKFIRKKRYEIL